VVDLVVVFSIIIGIFVGVIPILISVKLSVSNAAKDRQCNREMRESEFQHDRAMRESEFQHDREMRDKQWLKDKEMHENERNERREEQEKRKNERINALYTALYSELFISCQKLDGALTIDFYTYLKKPDMDMLQSTDKLRYGEPIKFPVYDFFKTRPILFYQLEGTFELDAAYFRVIAVNDAVNEFSRTPFNTVDEAQQKYDTFYGQFLEAARVINEAFLKNAHILEKIDNGTRLKKWREFTKGHVQINEKLSKTKVVVNRDGIPI